MIRIGIDVGGTNTDAVIMDGEAIVATAKFPTSGNVMDGVVGALQQVMGDAGIAQDAISAVMIGTTHFTNAMIERRHLSETAVIRLSLPAAACLPPMVDWPEDLKSAMGNHCWMAHGGYEFDGQEISPLDELEIDGIAREITAKGLKSIAISSVFSPVNSDMESRARDILLKRLPDARVTLSSDIGRLGLLERESAAIMNASLAELSEHTVDAFAKALSSLELACPWYITQNDGTLMNAQFVKDYPVLTFASGPTNSMRGASFLTGEQNAIVVDVGGTSTDIGALVKGFPRVASQAVDVGGVRTNFRMPDVLSIAVGGGTIVDAGADAGDEAIENVKIGPHSVGYRIHDEALVFGGSTMTCTDIAVGLGITSIGDSSAVDKLDRNLLQSVKARIDIMIAEATERMRVSSASIPVVAVGGGSVLIPEYIGDLPVLRPENYAVANAVGAAIGQISGEVDRIFSLGKLSREDALSAALAEATAKAIAAGADKDSIELLDQEDVPLAYLPGNATRIRLKVVGNLGVDDV